MKGVANYLISLFRPTTNLFELFYVDFTGSIPSSAHGADCYILIEVMKTNRLIAKITRHETLQVASGFVSEEIINPFEPAK